MQPAGRADHAGDLAALVEESQQSFPVCFGLRLLRWGGEGSSVGFSMGWEDITWRQFRNTKRFKHIQTQVSKEKYAIQYNLWVPTV